MEPSDPHALQAPPARGLGKVPGHLLEAGRILWRIHGASRSPIFFGKAGRYRFDDPEGRYGVMYAGMDAHCAFLETYGRVPGTQGIMLRSHLAAGAITSLETMKPLRLVDLRGHHLAQLRIDSAIFAHTDYAVTQRWSRAFHEHEDAFAGLLFHSRHDPLRFAVALFDRAGVDSLRVQQTRGLLAPEFAPNLEEILSLYEFAIV
jgi:hypothetical protein